MSETWSILHSGKGKPAENMAVDEALLEFSTKLNRPVLRFYGWSEPAATFGYSQHYEEVATWTHLRPLIRRPTGGGLVPHDADWTYSLIVPPAHSWYALKAVESYRKMHEWVLKAFSAINIETRLSPCCQKDLPGQCFIGAEQFDVLWSGKKVAGAAQRRNRHGLLIQGSVQPPPGVNRADWEEAMQCTLPEGYMVSWELLALDPEMTQRVADLETSKYLQASYNQRR